MQLLVQGQPGIVCSRKHNTLTQVAFLPMVSNLSLREKKQRNPEHGIFRKTPGLVNFMSHIFKKRDGELVQIQGDMATKHTHDP